MKRLVVLMFAVFIVLTIMIVYFNLIKDQKNNLNQNQENKYDDFNMIYITTSTIKSNTISINSNDTNNDVLSNLYISNEIENSDENYISNIQSTEAKSNRTVENVTIEVLKDTITNKSVKIIITDLNEENYAWDESFRIQKKIKSEWEELNTINDLIFTSIAHNLNSDKQLYLEINYADYYGELEKGIYRIVKSVYDNQYIDIYSNEFEIK